jgi:hypothetical protein
VLGGPRDAGADPLVAFEHVGAALDLVPRAKDAHPRRAVGRGDAKLGRGLGVDVVCAKGERERDEGDEPETTHARPSRRSTLVSMRTTSVLLGHVDVDGTLVVLDPGLARFWRHDAEPTSPGKRDPETFDLEIVGPDAQAAGRAYDREFDPRFLFDRTDPSGAREHFEAFARERGFEAAAELRAERVPHTHRVVSALAAGGGIGVVKYNGLWAVAVDAGPTRGAPVVGEVFADGDFRGRFLHVDVVLDEEAAIERTTTVAGVMVDHGQLMVAGLRALGGFRMWESLDGLADYVFWGADASKLAQEVGASRIEAEMFGWLDVPIDDVGQLAQPLQARVAKEGWAVGVDYRPHCNLERMNAVMRASPEDTAEIEVEGDRVVGFGNRWGDGIFDVARLEDGRGRCARVRLEVGSPATRERFRTLTSRSESA